MRKATRGHPLSEAEQQTNHRINRMRVRVEHIFARIAQMGGDLCRSIGLSQVRCMQIIGELEQVGRGAYTGALGYIGDNGPLDLNILIRTMSCWRDRLVFRAGAGIVADSLAERELKETRAKALGLLRALGVSA